MIKLTIKRKEGFVLNPNDRVVSGILTALVENDGYCPCNQEDVHKENTRCPCINYLTKDKCCCNLYLKLNKN